MSIGQFMPLPSSYKKPLEVEFLGSITRNVNGNGNDWIGAPLGDPDPSRMIVLTITNAGNSTARTVSSTIAGVSGTEVARGTNLFVFPSIHIAHVPTGTSGNISVAYSAATVNQIAVGIYRIIGMSSPTAYDSAGSEASSPLSLSVDVPQGGVVIGASRSSANVTTSWVGIDEDYDFTLSNSLIQAHSGAHRSFASGETNYNVSVSRSSAGSTHLCVASFGG